MHPQKDLLVAFGLGKLGPDDSQSIERHLEACRECCETLLDLKDDTFSGLVRSAQDADSARGSDAAAGVMFSLPPDATLPLVGAPAAPSDAVAGLPAELRDHPRYRIVGLLGRGGMGEVYRAEHRLMHRPVALKLISAELVRRPDAVARFRREVRAAARLAHPHIVAAYDAEQAGDAHFLAMEYVEGTDLATLVAERRRLPIAEACRYVCQAAEGMQHAHEQGMVHRDIKPHNLMLARDNRVRILDFGLAAFATEAAAGDAATTDEGRGIEPPHLTAVGSVMGTPDYIAPEQARDARAADIRSDIYSLGCSLWFLLTGKPPFQAEGVAAKLLAHVEQPPPKLIEARPDAPVGLSKIVNRMLAKDPAERFQTPAEVAAALAPYAQTAPRRRRLFWRSVAAGLLLSAAIVAAVVIRIQTDEGEFVVEVADKDVAVLVEKSGLKIHDSKTGRQYRLKPGRNPVRSGNYRIDVAELPAGLQVSTDTFRLTRGNESRVTVSFVPAPATVAEKPEEVSVAPSLPPPEVAGILPVGVNLLTDGSFEATQPGNLPRNWSPWLDDGPTSRCGVVEGGRTDKRCLEIVAIGTRAVVFADSLPLDRTKRFALKGWARFEGPETSRAIIKFNYFHNGKYLGANDLVGVASNRSDWQLLEKTDAADSYPEASPPVPSKGLARRGSTI